MTARRVALLPALLLCLVLGLPLRADPPRTDPDVAEIVTLVEAMLNGSADAARVEVELRKAMPVIAADFGTESREMIEMERLSVLTGYILGKVGPAAAEGRAMMERANRILGADDPLAYRAAAAFGLAVMATGRRTDALGFLSEAVAKAEWALPPADDALAELRMAQARVAGIAGFPDVALAALTAVLGPLEASGRSDPQAEVMRAAALSMLGNLTAPGDPEGSLPIYDRAIAAFDRQFAGVKHPDLVPPRVATVLARAEALVRLGRLAEAEAALAPLLARAEAVFGRDSALWSDIGFPLAVAIAGTEAASPRVPEALEMMAQVVKAREALLPPGSIELSKARINLAMLLAATGQGAAAAEQVRALEGPGGGAEVGQAVYALYTATQTGDLTTEQAVESILLWLQRARTSGAAAAQAMLTARLAAGSDQAGALLRAFSDATAEHAATQTALAALTAIPAEDRDPAQLDRALADNRRASARVSAAHDALAAARPDLAAATVALPLSLGQIRAALPADAALVVVETPGTAGDSGLIVAVSQTAVEWHTFQVPGEEVAAAIARLRGQIDLRLGTRGAAPLDDADPGRATPADFDLQAAHWLYQQTLGLVRGVTAGKDRLFLDLRGGLATLPPHLMVVSPPQDGALAQADWLIRHHGVTVLPSIAALVTTGQGAAPPARDLIAFADPVYPAGSGLAPLPETAGEVRSVADALGADGGALLLGPAASEAAVKAADLSRAGVLYFATHGLVAGDVIGRQVVNEPALALSAGAGEDGLLTASDISLLRLDARLVVLSACNTALGHSAGAEALSGLAQSFLYAGARGLLVSHWPVESRSAAHLMTQTFRQGAPDTALAPALAPAQGPALAPPLAPDQALRRAMLAMLEAPPDPRWRHPAFWAPFVAVGGGGS